MSDAVKTFERLPRNVLPSKYILDIDVDLEQLKFESCANIELTVFERTDTIVLNCVGLTIKSISLSQDGAPDVPLRYTLNAELQKLTVQSDRVLEEGRRAVLTVTFCGHFNKVIRGAFYQEERRGAAPVYGVATQFEACDARRAFPCWDEPDIKAQFDMSITAPADKTVLSNTDPRAETDLGNGRKRVDFKTTPNMSTYLVAFVVGEYDFVETHDSNGVRMRVYAPKGRAEDGRFALDVAAKALAFFASFFSVQYPLEKMDLVALNDLSFGAMENWGLVTFKNALLLVDNESSASHRQLVAEVVCHELAHQWFGNLVTLAWWSELWLNEGFAQWIGYLACHHIFPNFHIWTTFVTEELTCAMSLDCLSSSHALQVPLEDPDTIKEVFDAISYSKGACFVRMLFELVGEAAFRAGLGAYLARFQWANADTEQLAASLAHAAHDHTVVKFTRDWIYQTGYPIISVEEAKNGTTRTLSLSQTRFSLAGCSHLTSDNTWTVPVSVKFVNNDGSFVVRKFVMSAAHHEEHLSDIPEEAFLLMNPGFVGFYHVNYPLENLLALTGNIGALSVVERLNLLYDQFNICWSGKTSTETLLKLLVCLGESLKGGEEDAALWDEMMRVLQSIGYLADQCNMRGNFDRFVITLCENRMSSLGYERRENESHSSELLRETLVKTLGFAGHEPTKDFCTEKLCRFVEDTTTEQPKAPVLQVAVRYADNCTCRQVLALFERLSPSDKKNDLFAALSCTRDPDLMRELLDFAMGDQCSPTHLRTLLAKMCDSSQGRELFWHFFRANLAAVDIKLGDVLHRSLSETCRKFSSLEVASALEELSKEKSFSRLQKTVAQCVEAIRLRCNTFEREEKVLVSVLSKF